MDSVVKYIKVIGGAAGKEQILVGLDNGQVLHITNIYIYLYNNNIFIGFDVTS